MRRAETGMGERDGMYVTGIHHPTLASSPIPVHVTSDLPHVSSGTQAHRHRCEVMVAFFFSRSHLYRISVLLSSSHAFPADNPVNPRLGYVLESQCILGVKEEDIRLPRRSK